MNKNKSMADTVAFLYEDLQPIIEVVIEELEDLCNELKELTRKRLVASEEDTYWELVEDLSEMNHLCDVLFVDAGKVVLLGEKLNFDVNKRMKDIMTQL